MLHARHNLAIVRTSAWYDLIVTAGFMTPWTAAAVFSTFAALSAALGLTRPVPVPGTELLLFANLMGSVVVVWSVWRLRNASREVGLYDAGARMLFAAWQLYAVSQGASLLLLGFTAMEIVFGVLQAWPVRQEGREPESCLIAR